MTLLARVGMLDQAIDVAAEQLARFPESALTCPGIAELCQRAGRLDRLGGHLAAATGISSISWRRGFRSRIPVR